MSRASFSSGFGRRIQRAVRTVEQLAPQPIRGRNVNRRAAVGQFRLARVVAVSDSDSTPASVSPYVSPYVTASDSIDDCGAVNVVQVQLGTGTYREQLGQQTLDFVPTPGFLYYAAQPLNTFAEVGDLVTVHWWNHRYWIGEVLAGGCDSVSSDSFSDSASSDSFSESTSTPSHSVPSDSASSDSNPRTSLSCCDDIPATGTCTISNYQQYGGFPNPDWYTPAGVIDTTHSFATVLDAPLTGLAPPDPAIGYCNLNRQIVLALYCMDTPGTPNARIGLQAFLYDAGGATHQFAPGLLFRCDNPVGTYSATRLQFAGPGMPYRFDIEVSVP